MWAAWATLAVVAQFLHFAFLDASDAMYSTVLYFGYDLTFFALAMFAFSIAPWHRLAPKMAAFAFVWWSTVCLIGNAILEFFDITRPYEAAALFSAAAIIIMFGCMRFLLFKVPAIGAIKLDHLYLIVSSPRTWTGIVATILTGKGGAFAIWHPGASELFRYVHSGKQGIFAAIPQPHCPTNKKIVDIGPATKSRLEYLNSRIGARWSYLSNCLTMMGAIKYDR